MPQNKFVKVALPIHVPQVFDYKWESNVIPKKGMRVKVSCRNKQSVGIVVDSHTTIPPFKTKPVLEVIDEKPIIPYEILYLCQFGSKYYHHPYGEVLFSAIPKLIRQGKSLSRSQETYYQITSDGEKKVEENNLRSKLQKKCLEIFSGTNKLSKDHLKTLDVSTDTLKRLEKHLWIKADHSDKIHFTDDEKSVPLLKLNQEQSEIFSDINENLNTFSPNVVFGITGSGKTEIYIHLINEIIKQEKQALLLVPEISLTPQTIKRFRQKFDTHIVVFHSGLADKEKLDAWIDASNDKAKLVIGTRSAIFTPMPKLGLIIIDEEHDSSFKQQEQFKYSARDLAIVRAKKANIPIVLGSATPSVETLYNAKKKRYKLHHLTTRAANATLPSIEIIDLRSQITHDGLSTKMLDQIHHELSSDNQVLLFLNRRGFSPLILCKNCGYSVKCPRCSTNATFHKNTNKLLCHHCDSSQNIPTQCPDCQSDKIKPVGFGTQRIELALNEFFPKYPVVRIDRDTTKKRGSIKELIDQVHSGKPLILIGTQMIAKGHHFPNVTLVGVLGSDNGLYSGDYHAIENLGQLLVQVAGRAGRANKKGKVLIQTYNPSHSLLTTLIQKNYQEFSNQLLIDRKESNLPPYTHHTLFSSESHDPKFAIEALDHIKETLLSIKQDIECEILGPIPAVLEKKQGRFRYQLLIQSNSKKNMQQLLPLLAQPLYKQKRNSKAKIAITVDPCDLT